MKTPVDPTNPFGPSRYGFLWEVLRRKPGGHHLDYGAYDGKILAELRRTGVIASGVGVDVNRAVVAAHSTSMPDGTELWPIPKNSDPGFPGGEFDSASILDVIEHVVDQRGILRQIYDALKPGGILVVTVPREHAFSVFDLGNLKFRLPWFHKLYYSLRHSPEAYRLRYAESPDGLVGDIEKEKSWHQHFADVELGALLESVGFRVVAFDGTGRWARPLSIVRYFTPGRLRGIWEPLLEADARRYAECNLFCVAERPGATTERARPPSGGAAPEVGT